MKICSVCGSNTELFFEYDSHVSSYTPKSLLRRILPKLDKLVPARLTRLKAVSSNPFGGYIDVCNCCGYGKMRKIPSSESLAAYYSGKYWQWRSRNRFQFPEPDSYKKDNRALHQIDFVKHIFESPRTENSNRKILEIGAAGANASLLIRDTVRGEIELNVCEPGSQWLEYYKSVGVSRVAELFPFESTHHYDYIHTSHWLEHIGDIESTMIALSSLLKSGNYLFIEVSNTEYHYWDRYNIDTPHIHFFTKIHYLSYWLIMDFLARRLKYLDYHTRNFGSERKLTIHPISRGPILKRFLERIRISAL